MHVFVDESERGRNYLVGAILVPPATLADARRATRQLLCAGERRIHFNTERDSRRRELLSAMARTGFRGRIYSDVGPAVAARAACLTQLVADLADVVTPVRLIVEGRDAQRDAHDRQVLFAARRGGVGPNELTYEHLRAHEDPLLWPPDAILWAYGKGGDWRRRAESMIEKVTVISDSPDSAKPD